MRSAIARMSVVCSAFICAVLAFSNQTHGAQPPPPSLSDPVELSAFLDGVMLSGLNKHNAAGAVVAVVRDGELLYQNGYGYANIDQRIPAEPGRTLFRIGSISKLFTWIAVLQQYEAGRLDLDTDVNEYLESFSIPDTYDDPVTLRSLMSHTPGFEDILLRLFVREEDHIPGLEEIFTRQMPRRIMPPLQEAAYSNHGTGLAQYIVEKVSGMPFETYAEEYIFRPLGMDHSTFRQPVPAHLRQHLATGYAYRDGTFEERGFELVPMTGAGGATTTAADMAVFMNALLNYGRLGQKSLMDPATFAIMKEPALVHAEGMNPALHGFMDMSPRHLHVIGHGGNTFLFHSLLALFPEHNTGLFMSFSGEGAGTAYLKILEHFAGRYFPDTDPPPPFLSLEQDYLEGFAGRYIGNRRPHSDILKIIGLANTIDISVKDDRLLYTDFFGHTHLMPAIDSTTFFVEQNNTLVGFYRPPGENAQKLYLSAFPIVAADRARWHENLNSHLVILLVVLACILYIMIVWPWLHFARKLYDKKPRTRTGLPLFSKVSAWIVSLFLLLFYMISMLSVQGPDIVFGIPAAVRFGLFFPVASLPFVILMVVNAVYIWKTPQIKNLSRLFFSFATIAFILAIWQLHYLNMLGWKF